MWNKILWILILLAMWLFWFFYWTFIYVPNKQAEEERIMQEQLEQERENAPNLVKVEQETIIWQEDIISNEQRINDLREDIWAYKVVNIWNRKFTFHQMENNFLMMYVDWKEAFFVDLVPEILLNIQRIYGTENDYLIESWSNKTIYNPVSAYWMWVWEFNLGINYIKKSGDFYLINTEKWTFVFNPSIAVWNAVEYVDILEDFIYYNDWYVWILKGNDERRIKNLWVSNLEKNVIYYYNPNTKEKRNLYETDLNLTKIYFENGEIFFEEGGREIYRLENF